MSNTIDLTDDLYEGMMIANGYDSAIIGIAERCGQPDVLAYSVTRIVDQLVSEGMTYEEAGEYFSFNISGAYVGETTPVFIHDLLE